MIQNASTRARRALTGHKLSKEESHHDEFELLERHKFSWPYLCFRNDGTLRDATIRL